MARPQVRRRRPCAVTFAGLSFGLVALLGTGRALVHGTLGALPSPTRTRLRSRAAAEVKEAGPELAVDEPGLGGGAPEPTATIFVCTGSSCKTDGSPACMKMLRELAPDGVAVEETVCLGPCSSGPNVLATPLPEQDVAGGRATEAKRASGAKGSVEQPAGVVFTGIKTEQDAALLEPWGFASADSQGPLGALRMLIRSSQLDQVPWPILLYVGFNVGRLIVNLLFGVDLLRLLIDFVKGSG